MVFGVQFYLLHLKFISIVVGRKTVSHCIKNKITGVFWWWISWSESAYREEIRFYQFQEISGVVLMNSALLHWYSNIIVDILEDGVGLCFKTENKKNDWCHGDTLVCHGVTLVCHEDTLVILLVCYWSKESLLSNWSKGNRPFPLALLGSCIS